MRCHAHSLVLLAGLLRPSLGRAATVNVPGDYPTIQDAVLNAPDGSAIQIAPGRYPGQVRLENGTKSLTIQGNLADPSATVLDGGGTTPAVIRILNYTGNLVIEGLTVTGGHGGPGPGGGLGVGGGLEVFASNVVFRDCVVTGNTTDQHGGGAVVVSSGGTFERCIFQGNTAAAFGGAVLLDSGSTTTFEQCQFLGNESNLSVPAGGGGGALYISNSSPTLIGCLIQANRAKFGGGGVWVQSAFGAPPYVVTFIDTTIASNQVSRADSTQPAAEGGGMHIEDNTRAVLQRCRVRGNMANRGAGLNCFRGRYEVTDSIIEDNVVMRDGTDAGNGGGIFVTSVNPSPPVRGPAALVLRGTVVRRNSAETGGGLFIGGDFVLTKQRSTLDMEDSIFADNTGTATGGGLFVDRSVATIGDSFILTNHSGGVGGGIFADGSSSITIDNTTIAQNDAADHGGGISINQGGDLHVTQSRLFANSAPTFHAGALYVGDDPGPITGPPITGAVMGSVIADNGPDLQIVEDCHGDPSKVSAVTYSGNTIHDAGASLYWQPCGSVLVASTAALNGIAGKASGNVDAAPSFAHFLAAPAQIIAGTSSVLAWAVAGASPLTIDGGVGTTQGSTGTTDVAPLQTTTYTLSAPSGPLGTATVEIVTSPTGPPSGGQPIRGTRLLLKSSPRNRAKKSFVLVAKDAGIRIADPTAVGGSLRISTAAGDRFDNTYVLAASKWKRIGKPSAVKGYRYRDKAGPIKSVVVKNGKTLTAVGKGGQLGQTLGGNPDPVQVVVTTGTQRDCMSFAGGKFAPGRKYLATSAAPPAACP